MPDPSTLAGFITYLLYLIPIGAAILIGWVQITIQVRVQKDILKAQKIFNEKPIIIAKIIEFKDRCNHLLLDVNLGRDGVREKIEDLIKGFRDTQASFLSILFLFPKKESDNIMDEIHKIQVAIFRLRSEVRNNQVMEAHQTVSIVSKGCDSLTMRLARYTI